MVNPRRVTKELVLAVDLAGLGTVCVKLMLASHGRLQVVGYSVGGEGRGCQWVGFQLEAQLLCGSSHEKYGGYPWA